MSDGSKVKVDDMSGGEDGLGVGVPVGAAPGQQQQGQVVTSGALAALPQDPKNVQELMQYVQTLLQQMQEKFQTMSDQIISRIDDMGNRIDDLEKNIADLMTQAGVEGTDK